MNKTIHLLILFFLFITAGPVLPQDITLTVLPLKMYRQKDTISIGWTGADKDVQLRSSAIPGGGRDIKHYSPVHMPLWQGSGTKSFVYAKAVEAQYLDQDLKIGINYCILVSGSKKSEEFRIIMESSAAPTLVAPANEAELTDLTPEFKWSGNSPYYSILISDEPFQITEDNKLQGLNAIWQGTTRNKSIRYGEKTDIGSGAVPPPLMEGKTYNWLVLNNYDPAANIISTIVSDPRGFIYSSPGPASATLFLPARRDTLTTNDPIVFRWSPVEGAVNYRLDLFEENVINDNQALTAVWQKNVNNTETVLTDPNGLLRRLKYQWKVYAYDSKGRASVSESRDFFNKAKAGRITINLYDNKKAKLPFVKIIFNRIPGLRHPFVAEGPTDKEGYIDFKEMPYRTYAITAVKEGFISKTIQFDLNKSSVSHKIYLQPAKGNIYGNILEAGSGTKTANVLVTLTSLDSPDEDPKQQLSSHTGDFSFNVPYGIWELALKHDNFISPADRIITLNAGNNIVRENYELSSLNYKVSGSMINSFTQEKIYDAAIIIKQQGTEKEYQTLGDGSFSFLAQSGETEIICKKAGFSTKTYFWDISSNLSKTLSLDPGASNIGGTVTDDQDRYQPDVLITAVSESKEIKIMTGKDGSYQFSLPAGSWRITAGKTGYTSRDKHQIRLEYGQDISLNFTLLKNQSYIRGQIFEQKAGGLNILANAVVRIEETGNSIKTDGQGLYNLSVDAGEYILSAELSGYSFPEKKKVYAGGNDTITGINFTGTGNAAKISGIISGPGGPVPSVKVYALNLNTGVLTTAFSNNRGNFEFSLSYGDFNFWAEKPGYLSDTLKNRHLNPGVSYTSNTISLTRNAGIIQGGIESGGAALVGKSCAVEYTVFSRDNTAPVTFSGNFQFEVEAGAQVSLRAVCQDYLPSTVLKEVLAVNETKRLLLKVIPSEITYGGTVHSSKDGNPLAGATVSLTDRNSGNSQSAITNEKGSYQFNLVSGQYALAIAKPGFRNTSREFESTSGKSQANARDTLQSEEGDLSGLITDPGGTPSALSTITLYRNGVNVTPMQSDNDGRFRFNNLPAGFFSLKVTTANFYEANQNIYIDAGNVTRITIKLKPWTTGISGKTVNPAGSGMSDVQITIQSGAFARTIFSAADGTFKLDSLPEGDYSVLAYRSKHFADTAYTNLQLGEKSNLTGIQFTLAPYDGQVTLNPEGTSNTAILDFLFLSDKTGSQFGPLASDPFKFELPSGSYTLKLRTPGYAISSETGFNITGAHSFTVVVKQETKTLQGSVKNQDATPVQGIKFRLQPVTSGLEEASVLSDASGNFSFSNLPSGARYRAGCIASGYQCREAIVTAGQSDKVNVTAEDFTSTLSGTVSLDGKKTAQARIQVTGAGNPPKSVYPGIDGSFTIKNLRAKKGETLTLTAVIAGVPPASRNVELSAGKSQSGIALTLKTIKVTYTDILKTGNGPLSGQKVQVTVLNTKETLTTNNKGQFGLSNRRPGEIITIQTLLNKDGFDNIIKSVTLGNEASQTFETVVKEHNSRISINCSEPGFSLYLNGNVEKFIKGKSHNMNFLPAGSYRLSASKPGYFNETGELTLTLDGSTGSQKTAEFQITKITTGLYGTISEIVNGSKKAGRKNIRLILAETATQAADTVTTRDDGSYFFNTALAGACHLSVALPGYEAIAKTVTLQNAAVKSHLQLKAYPQSLSGRIRSDSSVNWQEVQVTLTSTDGEKYQTNCTPYGDYSFMNLKSGNAYTVKADYNQLSTGDTTMLILLGKASVYNGDLRNFPDIRGIVSLKDKGLSFATVTLTHTGNGKILTTETDVSGKFLFSGLQSGKYTLWAEKDGFINETGIQSVVVSDKGLEGSADFRLAPRETGIYGKVANSRGKSVSASVLFIRQGDTVSVSTDIQGMFLLKSASAGDYQISITHPAFDAFDSVITYAGGTLQEFNISLSPLRNRLTGQILSAYNESNALSNAAVYFTTEKGESDTTLSGSDGTFAITFSQPPGSYVNIDSIKAEGFRPILNQRLPLDEYGAAQQKFRLTPVFTHDGILSISVFDKGKLLTGIKVKLLPDAPGAKTRTSNKNPAVFSKLQVPGSYRVTVTKKNYPELSTQYNLTSSQGAIKDSLFYPSSQLIVTVTADGIKPLSARVTINNLLAEADTAKAGTYRTSPDLKAGDYLISVALLGSGRLPLTAYKSALDNNEVRSENVLLPWILPEVPDTLINTVIPVFLDIEPGFKVGKSKSKIAANLFYKGTGNEDFTPLEMKLDESGVANRYSAEIPKQATAGMVNYYFTITYKDGISSDPGRKIEAFYSNAAQPLSFKTIDPNVLKAISFSPTRLEVDSNLLTTKSTLPLAVNLYGEEGRNLNAFFDKNPNDTKNFSVTWSFDADKTIAKKSGSQISLSSQSKRMAALRAGKSGELTVYCTVKIKKVTLQKFIRIKIESLKAAKLFLRFENDNRILEKSGAVIELNNRNTEGYLFSAAGISEKGKEFHISPEWLLTDSAILNPARAEALSSGRFFPDSNVAGKDTLTIHDEASDIRFQVILQTYLKVEPEKNRAVRVNNGNNAWLEIPLGGLESGLRVDFTQPEVSKMLLVSTDAEVSGEVVNIELTPPQPFNQSGGAYVSLPLAKAGNTGKAYIGHWSSKNLEWEALETDDSRSNDSLITAWTASFSPFALQVESRPLGAYGFKVMPNPFTPRDPWALQLQYDVSSNKASKVGVVVEVFNMRGDRVYQSNKNFISKQNAIVAGLYKQSESNSQGERLGELAPYLWDGRTTEGKLCRNGRYILKLLVSDPEDQKIYLKKVVLLK